MTPSKRSSTRQPLAGRVAVVAGATRGAGRGIARALGEAGATVYCTGRSVTGNPSPYGRPETIDETAALIADAGGRAIAVRVDHTVPAEVEALFARIDRDEGRVDVLVNCVAGEDPLIGQMGYFLTTDLTNGEAGFRQAILSHLITAQAAARRMSSARRGLIVEVTENDLMMGGTNALSQVIKLAHKGIALNLAVEMRQYGVACVALTPGFLRSEAMLEHHGVTEANWRDAGKQDPNFLESESPLFVGRAVAALAADPHVLERSGQLCSSWELGRTYGFTDYDGRRPDWGRLHIDFSVLPPELVELLATAAEMHVAWLATVAGRTRQFKRKLPPKAKALRMKRGAAKSARSRKKARPRRSR